MIGANRVWFAWHYAQILSAMTTFFTIVFMIPLFLFIHEIADIFTEDQTVKSLLIQVMPVVFICFFFDSLQAQR